MGGGHYLLTGLNPPPPGSPNDPPFRLEINDFIRDTDMLNMYLLALVSIQNTPQEHITSAFQIGGIHGLPYTPWNDVNIGDSGFRGYCTHGTVLFPIWHRPYVALMEQVIWVEAGCIAASYRNPELRARYGRAAQRFRQPYWDWAANGWVPPILNTQEMVTVVAAPHGTWLEIPNPLLRYKFHPFNGRVWGQAGPDPGFGVWPQTIRYPSSGHANAHSQPRALQAAMSNNQLSLRDRTFNILAYIHDWDTFSTHRSMAKRPTPGSNDSVESIHNEVHNLIGGGGHMATGGAAGLDPIFFLHHSNVDRLVALWQALNPNTFVTPGDSGDGTATIPPGTTIDVHTNLTPFRRTDTAFWTSATSRDVTIFGSTYPELRGAGRMTPAQLQMQVRREINRLYRPSAAFTRTVSTGATYQETTKENAIKTAKGIVKRIPHVDIPEDGSDEHAGLKPTPMRPSAPTTKQYRDWIITVALKKYELPISGYVRLFLAENIPDNGGCSAPELVGSVSVFRTHGSGCANCNKGKETGEIVTGEVPLTGALMDNGKNMNDVEGIVTYLKNNLHWRCQLVDGSEVVLRDVPSLKVCVWSVPVAAPEHDYEFPTRGKFDVHYDVTHGRAGGYVEER
uniref:tyrosinase n=1 Tax=Grifola frondosa TaxID=5627 RepID=A0A679FRT0_GRIFR|nr:tyrosinase2 [Grifola frondosa]